MNRSISVYKLTVQSTGDLGPVDPQFRLANGSLVAARAIIAAVEEAESRIEKNPKTYALHASLLTDITALMVQQSRDAMARSKDLVREALASVSSRTPEDVKRLTDALNQHLVGEPKDHGAVVSAADAKRYGLPVEEADPSTPRWQAVWQLWTKYLVITAAFKAPYVYESELASQIGDAG